MTPKPPPMKTAKGMDDKYLKRVLEKFPTIKKEMEGRYDEIELVAFIDVLAVLADEKFHIISGSMCKNLPHEGINSMDKEKIKLIREFNQKWQELRKT